ncbi:MAG: DedA family protein [Pseudomonadota bacterium]
MSFQEIADAIVTFARTNPEWLAPILLLLAFGESIAFVSLLLPFWWMLIALGALVGTGGYEFMIALAAASVGAALGDWVSYWLGYHFSDRIKMMWPFTRYPTLMPRGEAFFQKYGVWAIVLGRFSGPLRATVPVVAGATRMHWVPFQIANWLSAVLWAGVLLLFGGGLGEIFGYVSNWMGWQ